MIKIDIMKCLHGHAVLLSTGEKGYIRSVRNIYPTHEGPIEIRFDGYIIDEETEEKILCSWKEDGTDRWISGLPKNIIGMWENE